MNYSRDIIVIDDDTPPAAPHVPISSSSSNDVNRSTSNDPKSNINESTASNANTSSISSASNNESSYVAHLTGSPTSKNGPIEVYDNDNDDVFECQICYQEVALSEAKTHHKTNSLHRELFAKVQHEAKSRPTEGCCHLCKDISIDPFYKEDDLFVCDNENCCSEAHYRCIGYEYKADGMNCEWYCTFCMNEYKKLSVSNDFEVACEINKCYSKHARKNYKEIKDDDPFWCKYCKVRVTSMEYHEQQTGHRTNKANYTDIVDTKNYCNLCQVKVCDAEGMKDHCESTIHIIRKEHLEAATDESENDLYRHRSVMQKLKKKVRTSADKQLDYILANAMEDETLSRCDICDADFKTHKHLLLHCKTKGHKLNVTQLGKSNSSNTYCDVCDKQFKQVSDLLHHQYNSSEHRSKARKQRDGGASSGAAGGNTRSKVTNKRKYEPLEESDEAEQELPLFDPKFIEKEFCCIICRLHFDGPKGLEHHLKTPVHNTQLALYGERHLQQRVRGVCYCCKLVTFGPESGPTTKCSTVSCPAQIHLSCHVTGSADSSSSSSSNGTELTPWLCNICTDGPQKRSRLDSVKEKYHCQLCQKTMNRATKDNHLKESSHRAREREKEIQMEETKKGVHGLCLVCRRVCYPDDIVLNDELLFCIHRTDNRPDKCQSQCHKKCILKLEGYDINNKVENICISNWECIYCIGSADATVASSAVNNSAIQSVEGSGVAVGSGSDKLLRTRYSRTSLFLLLSQLGNLTQLLTHSLLLTYLLTHLLTYSLTHLFIYLLTYSLTHSLTYSPTH
jgi:hypothetical protein